MTDEIKSVEAVIQQAIKGEEDSHALYLGSAKLVKGRQAQEMLEELAKDELGHKAKLEGVLRQGLAGAIIQGSAHKVHDLHTGDHLIAMPLSEKSDLQAVLLVAIQREKESHALYQTMAEVTCDVTIHNLFEFLANEELSHKQKLEALYEEVVYQHF